MVRRHEWENEKLRTYRKIFEEKIGMDLPIIFHATPSVWRDVYGRDAYPVYAFEVDPLVVQTSKLTKAVNLHEIQTAIRRYTNNTNIEVGFLNTNGLCFYIDERLSKFPELIPLPMPPQSDYLVPFGVTQKGQDNWKPIHIVQNTVLGGQSRWGKTMFMSSWIVWLMFQHSPDDLRLVMIDGKGVDFSLFEGQSHLLCDIAYDAVGAEFALGVIQKEIKKRSALFRSMRVRSLDGLRKKSGINLPTIVVFLDELFNLTKNGFPVGIVEEILSTCAGFGIYCIVSSQRPDADLIKKTNFNTVITFRPANSAESKVLFDSTAPYKTLSQCTPGEFVALGPDMDYLHLKGYFVDIDNLNLDKVRASTTTTKGFNQPAIDLSPLTKNEAVLVLAAIKKNNSYCSVNGMYNVMSSEPVLAKLTETGGPFTKYKLQNLLKEWENRGWLTEPKKAADGSDLGRQVTKQLREWAKQKFHGGG